MAKTGQTTFAIFCQRGHHLLKILPVVWEVFGGAELSSDVYVYLHKINTCGPKLQRFYAQMMSLSSNRGSF